MKKLISILLIYTLWLSTAFSSTTTVRQIDQIQPFTGSVSIGSTAANANAILDLQSTTKAFMPPRMTTAQMNAIASPTAGMTVFNTDYGMNAFYTGSSWAFGVNNLQLDNVYSAQVTSVGATSNLNKTGWLTGNCVVTNTAQYDCPVLAGIFTVVPNCTGLTVGTVFDNRALIYDFANSTTTNLRFRQNNSNNGAAIAYAFGISCQKAGVDYAASSSSVFATSSNSTIALATDFSWQISATGVVSGENLDVVNGNCTNANPFVCTFNTGIFTVTPNCSVTSASGNNNIGQTSAQSSTSISVRSFTSTSGSNSQDVMTVHCQKAGVDYTNAVHPFIVGSFAGYAQAPGVAISNNPNLDHFKFNFGTTDANTPCTANPCSYLDETTTGSTKAVASVARGATGTYTPTFNRTYAKLKCTSVTVNSGGALGFINPSTSSCTTCNSFTVTTRNSGDSSTLDSKVMFDCDGVY